MDKFRSVALYAEVKLTEALTRVKTMRLKANDGNPVPEDEPDRLRTAVCMQVFSELCKMAGPFSSVLQRLRDEFVLSMYSDYYLSEGGDSVFDQQPYFSAIKRIEAGARAAPRRAGAVPGPPDGPGGGHLRD